MVVIIDPHAAERMAEREAREDEVIATVEQGEQFPAKKGRTGFRRNFPYNADWNGKRYATKQVEVYAIQEDSNWIVVTIITKFF